jgi:hypothetical protein
MDFDGVNDLELREKRIEKASLIVLDSDFAIMHPVERLP